jgi:predicted  nucleic acid-binding Zn-ribbon protein
MPGGVAMNDTSAVDAATQRLRLALDALEAALDHRLEAERDQGSLAEQMHGLDLDRARLASELDQAVERSRRLEGTSRDVSQRLEAAMATIRQMIEAGEP